MRTASSDDGLEPLHQAIIEAQLDLSAIINVAEDVLTEDHDGQKVHDLAQGFILASEGLRRMHAIIDVGIPRKIPQEPYTFGQIPLTELPPEDLPTLDPGSPEERRSKNYGEDRRDQPGRHRLPDGIDMIVSPEERGEIT